MADSDILSLVQFYKSSQDKYTYLLLAVSASAVAFTLQKTENVVFEWSLLPVGLSALSFGLSFWFGAKNIVWGLAATYENIHLLQLAKRAHPDAPLVSEDRQAAIHDVVLKLDKHDKNARLSATRQYQTLITGALFYISWQLLLIWQRTCAQ